MGHFCLISADGYEGDIAAAEVWAFAGVRATGRVVDVPRLVDVSHAAHIAFCAERLAAGPTLEAVCEQIAGMGLEYERFAVSVTTLPPRPEIDLRETVISVARHINGTVDLDAPLNEIALVGNAAEWHLGRVVSRWSRSFRAHEHKPHVFSSSLPARISRVMVNLAQCPGGTIIDPCCGVGSILLEAWAVGARAVGADLNPKLAGMTQLNLRHFDRPEWVCAADASTLGACGDAVVTDFPYGRQSARADGLYERLLSNFPSLAPRLVIVVAEEIDDLLAEVGYRVVCRARVPKGRMFERRITVAEVVR